MKINRTLGRSIGLVVLFSSILIPFFQNCSNSQFTASDGVIINSSNSTAGTTPDPDQSSPPVTPLPSQPVIEPVPVGGTITDLKIENAGSADQQKVPFTFGHIFHQGQVAKGDLIAGKLQDGVVLPLQMDVKATHSDGSVRHAVISGVIPNLPLLQVQTLSLVKASGTANPSTLTPTDLVNAGFVAGVQINLSGTVYRVSVDELLKSSTAKTWLSGAIANEWLLSSPFKTEQGVVHPHLTARFAIRAFSGMSRAKVDIIIENNWTYETAPQNFTYDVQVSLGGKTVYNKTALTHHRQARWRKTFWWGEEPLTHIKHNTGYLIASRAVANYDQTLTISESTLAGYKTAWTGTKIEPMGAGIAQPYMPTTGGRADIGLLPGWVVSYLLSMDKRAKDVSIGNADLAGSWPMHYRDKNTDRPLSIADYPYVSILGNPGDQINPATKKSEALPACGGTCTSPNAPDVSHQPNFSYLPYLVTGDHYLLEELQFWASYTTILGNPYYREFQKGLLKSDQLRGQAWGLRTIAEAAFISPDSDPLKAHFNSIVEHNLDWYNANYTNNTSANSLGVIINGATVVYSIGSANTGLAPWQDDFFTQSIGHVAELGFAKAKPLLLWKSKFQIGRMVDPEYCWIHGATYSLKVRDSASSPYYSNLGQAYAATMDATQKSLACGSTEMATSLNLKVGEMTGYSSANAGFPSNYQPALAYSIDSGAPNGAKAWQVFMGRSVKPDYHNSPQFAIVPR